MRNRIELTLLITILLVLGIGTTIYKINVLGFSFSPDKKETVWTVEGRVNFNADGGPVTISLNLPDNRGGLVVTENLRQAPGYTFSRTTTKDGVGRAVWTRKDTPKGPQHIYYRVNIFRKKSARKVSPTKAPTALIKLSQPFQGAYLDAAETLIKKSQKPDHDIIKTGTSLINELNSPEKNQSAAVLLEMPRDFGGRLGLASDLLTQAKIHNRVVKGLLLSKNNRNKNLSGFIEIFDGKKWQLINPKTAEVENPDAFLIWQQHDESLLEIEGGSKAKIRFSSLATKILANRAAIKGGQHQHSWLVDFSIYSLPISSQNAFKILLLIPFGALIVVILRNLVGIQTSGTFMPILIALSFLQTTLVVGLILFLTVVCVGLILRALLSHLNLLLVPRISAILVFVITIYLAISVIGFKMGSEVGLNVTFFPMIIISWSIERMCVLWEEEGGKDVLIQGSGSLFTASVIYVLMKNNFIGNMTYAFPELLLVLLAIILMIGTYSGYRLSELRRFEPMGRE
jgi:hypothetical protein